jgi:hypothetical protein
MDGTHQIPASDRQTLVRLQRLLAVTLMAGIAGMGLELLLIGHVEDRLQLVPVGLLGAGAIAVAWHAVRSSALSLRIVRVLMALFVGSGVLGVGLHYRGNHEFELEMYPSLTGIELVRKTLTGATPVLAPGSMAVLGFIGLAAVYRTPPAKADRTGVGRDAL